MKACRRLSRASIGLLAIALTGAAQRAEAACDTVGTPSTNPANPCYVLKGSDTLFDIVTQAITTARTNGVPGATDLFYFGSGSGNAETAMRTSNTTDIGVQSIGPMSRNMRPSIIDSAAGSFKAAALGDSTKTCNTGSPAGTNCGHAAWAPGVNNVVGLDAAVFLVQQNVQLSDIAFTTFVDPAGPTTIKKADKNNSSITSNFGNGAGFNNLTAACKTCGQSGQPACTASCANYNNLMSIVLSGIDGSGTMAACSDPRRIQAIQDIAGLLGVPTINHIFRRDDNSGTTDTFKDRIMVVPNSGTESTTGYPNTGGRFCNGQSLGNITGAQVLTGFCSVARTTCTTNAGCPSGQVCQFNLNNQDFDPVRRPCAAASATAAPTSCTDETTGAPCQASDGNPNCTQGLIVALTDTDPGSSDITNSIGRRVGTSDGSILGYAGREATVGTGARGLSVNGIAPADDRVRDSTYLLARRLFVQNTFINSTAAADVPTDGQNAPLTVNTITGGGTDQRTKEQTLWTQVLSNRAIMDPIVRGLGFIRCSGIADGNDPSSETNNLCALTPAPAVTAPLGGLPPAGQQGSGTGTGIAFTINHQGRVWNGTTAVSATCSGTALCESGGTCAASACPDAAALPANAPCTVTTDCGTGLICANAFGHSTGGKDGLYCCDPAGGNPLCH
jgi:hypothetical protein